MGFLPPTKPAYITTSMDSVHVIDIPESERASGVPSASVIGEAVAAVHRDGIVVLNNAVPVEIIDKLNEVLTAEIPSLVCKDSTHFNGGKATGNIAQSPPLQADYMYPDIWANAFTLGVVSSIMGPVPNVNYVLGNTALRGTNRQQVHADLNFNYASFMTFGLVANYYLCDTDETNGATEVWLRSHTRTHFDLHQKNDSYIEPRHLADAQRDGLRPIRPGVKRGSVVIRDLRLWHAGIPNGTDDPRIMLAFVHFPWWYQNFKKIVLPESVRPFIESVKDKVNYNVQYVPGTTLTSEQIAFEAFFGSGNEAFNSMIVPRINTGDNPYTKKDVAAAERKNGIVETVKEVVASA